MVRRENGFNYPRAVKIIGKLCDEGLIYGGELMMLVHYYDKQEAVTDLVKNSDIPFPVIHCEKGVGTSLSRAAALYSEGKFADADTLFDELISVFRMNCRFGEKVGASHMVFHLWSGIDSDSHIEYNCEKAPFLKEIAKKHGLDLLFETIPCSTHDPHSNLRYLLKSMDNAEFIYDTRLSALHGQECEILKDADIYSRIRHVHVSDFRGELRDFSALRPIYHPREGQIDFESIAALLKSNEYSGRFTLESPVTYDDERDIYKLRDTFRYLASIF